LSLNNLAEVLSGSFEGDLMYTVSTTPVVLGGRSLKKHEEILLMLPHEYNDIVSAILIINASLTEELGNIYWKVRFNDIMLSREFKPQIVTSSNEGKYLTFIYDVKPIMKPKQLKNVLSIGFEASNPITIESAMLLLIHRVPEASIDLNLYAGTSVIEPSHKLDIDMGFRRRISSKGSCLILLSIPSKACSLSFAVNNKVLKRVSEVLGTYELELEYPLSGLRNKLSIIYHDVKGRIFPKEVKVNTVLAFQRAVPEPRIVSRVVKVRESGDYVEVDVEVSNVGSGDVKDVIIQVMSVGAILYREVIDELKAGGGTVIKFKLLKKVIEQPVTIRTIYRVLGRPLFTDVRLNDVVK